MSPTRITSMTPVTRSRKTRAVKRKRLIIPTAEVRIKWGGRWPKTVVIKFDIAESFSRKPEYHDLSTGEDFLPIRKYASGRETVTITGFLKPVKEKRRRKHGV